MVTEMAGICKGDLEKCDGAFRNGALKMHQSELPTVSDSTPVPKDHSLRFRFR